MLAVAEDGALTVTVTDWGTWKPPDHTDHLRGRGLVLIGHLADDSTCVPGDDGARMTWRLHPPA